MVDRPHVPVDKPIDLAALDDTLGGHGLCIGDNLVMVADGSPVTQEALEAAVAAHVPPPAPEPPPDPQVEIAGLRARLEALEASMPALIEIAGPLLAVLSREVGST